MDLRQIRKGDIERAFDQADMIVQGVYRPAAIEQVPLETQVALGRARARRPPDDLLLHAGDVLLDGRGRGAPQRPLNRLKFVGGTVGGGFGGKVDTAAETVAALLALKAGRPVKWRWTREEEFLCSSTRAPWHMEIADAVTEDGWILGRKMLTLHDAGAYARFSPYGADEAQLPPHRRVHDPATSTSTATSSARTTCRPPPCAGSASPRVSFAIEMHMSRIADVLGMDPLEFRLKNANRIGDTSPNGIVYTDPSTVPTIQAVAEAVGHELPADYRAMTNDAARGRAAARAPRRAGSGNGGLSDGEAPRPRPRRDRVSDRHEPGRRPVAGLDQDEAGRPRRRLRRERRHRPGLEDRPHARSSRTRSASLRLGHDGQLQHRLVAALHGHVRLARHVHRRQRRGEGGDEGQAKLLEIAGKELEIDPADLEVVDGEVIAKGAPEKKIGVPDVAAAATWSSAR